MEVGANYIRTYSGCYYIVSAVKNDSGEEEYAEIISDDDKKDKDGAQVRLWTKAKKCRL